MEPNTFNRFLIYYMLRNPELRKGQAAFNLMEKLCPTKANQYRGTDLDPFYHDERTDAFINACLNC